MPTVMLSLTTLTNLKINMVRMPMETRFPSLYALVKKHDYLGMAFNYSSNKKFKIDMTKYMQKILNNLGPEFDGIAVTPSPSHIFDINEEWPLLNKETDEIFYHIVAQFFFSR